LVGTSSTAKGCNPPPFFTIIIRDVITDKIQHMAVHGNYEFTSNTTKREEEGRRIITVG
jgi:hypothetical protein